MHQRARPAGLYTQCIRAHLCCTLCWPQSAACPALASRPGSPPTPPRSGGKQIILRPRPRSAPHSRREGCMCCGMWPGAQAASRWAGLRGGSRWAGRGAAAIAHPSAQGDSDPAVRRHASNGRRRDSGAGRKLSAPGQPGWRKTQVPALTPPTDAASEAPAPRGPGGTRCRAQTCRVVARHGGRTRAGRSAGVH